MTATLAQVLTLYAVVAQFAAIVFAAGIVWQKVKGYEKRHADHERHIEALYGRVNGVEIKQAKLEGEHQTFVEHHAVGVPDVQG